MLVPEDPRHVRSGYFSPAAGPGHSSEQAAQQAQSFWSGCALLSGVARLVSL